ncbi:MAG: hypothetical protein QOD86_135 [Miltoncostaeaceae bacterium]|jgi:hypothetical protein|nr:hypothetical protein [Miltoncostaeaceae bacterium]
MRTPRSSTLARALLLLAGALLLLTPPAGAAPPDRADGLDIYERDVFEIVGSTLRNPTEATDAVAGLYNVAGVRLEAPDGTPVTWGSWSAASAESTARTVGGATEARIQLTGLVPGGLYSIFWGTLQPDSEQPLCPGVERTLPLDAFPRARAGAPAPNAFVAGANGTASYTGRADARLLDAGQVFVSVVFHAAGRTAYPFPNLGELLTHEGAECRSSFGEDTMRQLLILQKW